MKRILPDSSAWIEFFVDGPKAQAVSAYFKEPESLLVPTLVIYEVYKKIKQSKGEEIAIAAAAQLGKTKVVELSESIALLAADLSLSRKLAMADAIVLATAQSSGAEILTLDPDFEGIEGVVVLRKAKK